MHPHMELIEHFYRSFQRLDAAAMNACYHPKIVFSDPVFLTLRGDEARAMWEMLCRNAREFELRFSEVQADEKRGSAHWEADYTFSKTGRRVYNRIEASFQFHDGLIVEHHDSFSLWRWASQALGLQGALLGWLPPVQAAIRAEARKNLERYIQGR